MRFPWVIIALPPWAFISTFFRWEFKEQIIFESIRILIFIIQVCAFIIMKKQLKTNNDGTER